MATETATDLGLAILGRLRYAGNESRPRGLPAARPARRARTGYRLARGLEDAVLIVGTWAVGLGLGLIAYGVTCAIVGKP
jgi:hypothetical protein